MVFNAWNLIPDNLQKWWGPKGFTNPVCNADAIHGGEILIHMQAPDKTISSIWLENSMKLLNPKIGIADLAALDKNGNRLFEILNTVTFLRRKWQDEDQLACCCFKHYGRRQTDPRWYE